MGVSTRGQDYELCTILCAQECYSAFTLPTSEPCQTGLVSFSKANISKTTDTYQVSVVNL